MSEAPELPPAVRDRVAALAADVLPRLETVPARLRRIADFAPARRARVGGGQIVAVLADDAATRARVGELVADRLDAGETGGTGAPGGTAEDPLDAAARAWLARPEGWERTVADAATRLDARAGEQAAVRETRLVAQAEDRASRAEDQLAQVRGERRRQLDELREEVTTLRRRLGESRAREREARRELEGAVAELEDARREARHVAGEGDAERRRLRTRVSELEAANAALRRTGREDRDEAGLRVRVLLDSVAEAAAGLRRELLLPSAEGAPGDRLEQRIAERAVDASAVTGRDGPAALEQYLAVPRARLLVDGYNVSKTAWPEVSLEDQRTRLTRALGPLVARTGAETTVVFDAAASVARPPTAPPTPRGVRVLFSPPGVIADDVVGELVEAEPTGRMVVVVSSDQEVARHAARHGARAVGSPALLALLA